MPQLMS